MRRLDYPRLFFVLGSVAGWSVFFIAQLLFRMPNAALAAGFAAVEKIMLTLGKEGPASRAVADIRFVFGQGGEGAAIFRRLATHSRAEELVALIRGAILRSLT